MAKKSNQSVDSGKSETRKLIKSYLRRYIVAQRRSIALTERLKNLKAEMEDPLKGISYRPVTGSANKTDEGAAAFVYRMDEMMSRIITQKAEAEKTLVEIMDIIDYLPAETIEREIIEYKYIDNMYWQDIFQTVRMEKSQCYAALNRGVDKLATYQRVVNIVTEWEEKQSQKRLLV